MHDTDTAERMLAQALAGRLQAGGKNFLLRLPDEAARQQERARFVEDPRRFREQAETLA